MGRGNPPRPPRREAGWGTHRGDPWWLGRDTPSWGVRARLSHDCAGGGALVHKGCLTMEIDCTGFAHVEARYETSPEAACKSLSGC